MSQLRKVTFLGFLLTGALACSLTAGPASPTARLQVSTTTTSASDTPVVTATAQASATPALTEPASPSETPNAQSPSLPLPFANLSGISQYYNPVGQPVQTWNGIPIMPQATAGQEFKPGAVYSFKATAVISQAVSFYQGKMPALGYAINGGPGTGSAGTGSNALHNSFLYYFKGSQIILMYILSYDNNPGHIIVVISTQ
jgi:hypothetical protein